MGSRERATEASRLIENPPALRCTSAGHQASIVRCGTRPQYLQYLGSVEIPLSPQPSGICRQPLPVAFPVCEARAAMRRLQRSASLLQVAPRFEKESDSTANSSHVSLLGHIRTPRLWVVCLCFYDLLLSMIAYLEAPATQIGGCSFVDAAQRPRDDSGIRFGRGRSIPSAFLETHHAPILSL